MKDILTKKLTNSMKNMEGPWVKLLVEFSQIPLVNLEQKLSKNDNI